MDKSTEMQSIQEYLNQYPKDNSDIFTLLHTIGHETFFKALQEADGRRIVLYHLPEDRDKCDPPIYWKYGRRNHV